MDKYEEIDKMFGVIERTIKLSDDYRLSVDPESEIGVIIKEASNKIIELIRKDGVVGDSPVNNLEIEVGVWYDWIPCEINQPPIGIDPEDIVKVELRDGCILTTRKANYFQWGTDNDHARNREIIRFMLVEPD